MLTDPSSNSKSTQWEQVAVLHFTVHDHLPQHPSESTKLSSQRQSTWGGLWNRDKQGTYTFVFVNLEIKNAACLYE